MVKNDGPARPFKIPLRSPDQLDPNRHAPRWEHNKFNRELIEGNSNNKRGNTYPSPKPKIANTQNTRSQSSMQRPEPGRLSCMGCYQTGHLLYKCQEFLSLSLDERWKIVRGKNICSICLNGVHSLLKCTGGPCSAAQPHNSTLCRSGFQDRR